MRTTRLAAALTAAVLVPGVSISVAAHDAQTFTVNCTRGQTIAKALELGDARKPLVLIIRGICRENVTITRDRVTLQGDPPRIATVQAVNPQANTITVTATGVNIEGLTVIGGLNGILAFGVSALSVTNSVIQNAAQNGISLGASFGVLVGNTIQYNRGSGVLLTAAQAYVTDSEIAMNAGAGIRLNNNSTLAVSDTTSSANGVYGIHLTGGSDAQISGVTLSGNGTNPGIPVLFKGGASIESATAQFNNATISSNLGRGLIVNNGGSINSFNTAVTGNAAEGVIFYLGAIGNINGGTISTNGGHGLWLGVNSTAQVGNVSIMNNAQHGIVLSLGSKLWTNSVPMTVGGNAWFGLFCNDGESSAANESNFTFLPANGSGSWSCTGY